MLKNSLILIVLLLFSSLALAETLNLDVIINKNNKMLSQNDFLKYSKESFELKDQSHPILSMVQIAKLFKIKKCTFVELTSQEGMKIAVSFKEFDKACILLFQDKKSSYYRLIIKDDTFRNRWIKYIVKLEFK